MSYTLSHTDVKNVLVMNLGEKLIILRYTINHSIDQ